MREESKDGRIFKDQFYSLGDEFLAAKENCVIRTYICFTYSQSFVISWISGLGFSFVGITCNCKEKKKKKKDMKT